MSVAYRFKSEIPSPFPKAAGAADPATIYRPQAAEAPDRGFSGEAPEARTTSEAPDAGDGRASHMEHEYTHGRSQS